MQNERFRRQGALQINSVVVMMCIVTMIFYICSIYPLSLVAATVRRGHRVIYGLSLLSDLTPYFGTPKYHNSTSSNCYLWPFMFLYIVASIIDFLWKRR